MKLLLDTHIFIWWDSEPHKLSANALKALSDPANVLVLSVASIWEMQIKSGYDVSASRVSPAVRATDSLSVMKAR